MIYATITASRAYSTVAVPRQIFASVTAPSIPVDSHGLLYDVDTGAFLFDVDTGAPLTA